VVVVLLRVDAEVGNIITHLHDDDDDRRRKRRRRVDL